MNTSAKDIQEFVGFWTGKGYEKGQTQPFYADHLVGIQSSYRFLSLRIVSSN